MHIRPSLIVIENNKILCLKYTYNQSVVYNLPGGNLEFGEKMDETLVRELFEELNIQVAVQNLEFVAEVHLPQKSTLHCMFSGIIVSGKPIINPSETTAEEVCWVEIDELKHLHLYPNIAEPLANWVSTQTKTNLYLGAIDQHWF
jgi:8-oxo-dGTP diphosphatase